eukprot:13321693-Heterocapsa_arctica.AAC.1
MAYDNQGTSDYHDPAFLEPNFNRGQAQHRKYQNSANRRWARRELTWGQPGDHDHGKVVPM